MSYFNMFEYVYLTITYLIGSHPLLHTESLTITLVIVSLIILLAMIKTLTMCWIAQTKEIYKFFLVKIIISLHSLFNN